ncbi:mitochondrial import inner membrane translocase subunit tim21 [Dimargaris cristalligena]|uniref:Mitochondrial import inner membrane translocase subunit Tim21 n=1 Tax=Dimargaris cristalligena TaxID=215637 RepID=A0A4V1J5T0_9FUNG|nr:mitochondrial import inner membrane translocase subunit tim21 [Dimargaris cristalligena]RKP40129.1 TIM21-domain-containing protein [Dimargaris cristalligena]|eukprot:RKP40129.1 TIM21-domain-containing protein [Dimargaris cristalligena]
MARVVVVRAYSQEPLLDRTRNALGTLGNLAVVLAGLTVLCGLPYFLFADLVGDEGHIKWFSDALQRVRRDPNVQERIGSPIKGFGDPSQSRMSRNRTIGHMITQDRHGVEHMVMRFFIEGPLNSGTVKLELVKGPEGHWQYRYILVEVPGQGLPSWRIVVDTEQPPPPPAWREIVKDSSEFVYEKSVTLAESVRLLSLATYDQVKEWIETLRRQ